MAEPGPELARGIRSRLSRPSLKTVFNLIWLAAIAWLVAVALGLTGGAEASPNRSAGTGATPYSGGYVVEPAAPYGSPAPGSSSYSSQEVISAGHAFFGQVSGGLASVVERIFSSFGEPVGYILGEEAAGAFVGGLRYGEGTLYTRGYGTLPIYWQGPSVGWDFGGDGARVMMLVYQLPNLDTLYQRFTGVNGSAYLIGGVGMTVLAADDTYIVPVRSGIGARLGVNFGYLKFTREPTWNPF